MDLATCLIQPSGILVTVSPGMAQPVMQRLEKFILYGDKVGLGLVLVVLLQVLKVGCCQI